MVESSQMFQTEAGMEEAFVQLILHRADFTVSSGVSCRLAPAALLLCPSSGKEALPRPRDTNHSPGPTVSGAPCAEGSSRSRDKWLRASSRGCPRPWPWVGQGIRWRQPCAAAGLGQQPEPPVVTSNNDSQCAKSPGATAPGLRAVVTANALASTCPHDAGTLVS